jgi:hypothetical protein
MVKIPGTEEGLAPIEQMIAEGRCINVTLIFSLDRYSKVIEAYLRGLERLAEDPTPICHGLRASPASSSAASTPRSTAGSTPIGTDEALALRGKAAVAQGKLAYQLFLEAFSGPRWEALAARGARVQRPLWASTSTKNPAYPDTLYVDELIGPTRSTRCPTTRSRRSPTTARSRDGSTPTSTTPARCGRRSPGRRRHGRRRRPTRTRGRRELPEVVRRADHRPRRQSRHPRLTEIGEVTRSSNCEIRSAGHLRANRSEFSGRVGSGDLDEAAGVALGAVRGDRGGLLGLGHAVAVEGP